MENNSYLGMFADFMNNPKAEISSDGKAINISGQIADGIYEKITIRPSNSRGIAADVDFDGKIIRHIDSSPKF